MDYCRPWGDVIRGPPRIYNGTAEMSETDITFARSLSTLMPCFLGGAGF